jgi:hypothetical protein
MKLKLIVKILAVIAVLAMTYRDTSRKTLEYYHAADSGVFKSPVWTPPDFTLIRNNEKWNADSWGGTNKIKQTISGDRYKTSFLDDPQQMYISPAGDVAYRTQQGRMMVYADTGTCDASMNPGTKGVPTGAKTVGDASFDNNMLRWNIERDMKMVVIGGIFWAIMFGIWSAVKVGGSIFVVWCLWGFAQIFRRSAAKRKELAHS